MISGISEQEAAAFLRLYVSQHPDEQLAFDGTSLTTGIPTLAEEPGPQAATAGIPLASDPGYGVPPPGGYEVPLPEGYGVSSYTPDLTLGEEPSGWLWLLPLFLGWIGGIIAWALAKDKNSRTARNMLITGVSISVLAACLGFGVGFITGGSAPTDTPWPVTERMTFYYFGSPG